MRTPQSSPDGGSVRVNVNNECGWSGFTGITVFPGCFFFITFPNPSSEELTIATNQSVEQETNGLLSTESTNLLLKNEYTAEQ